METQYDQLDIDERYELYRLHKARTSLREIDRIRRKVSEV